MMDFDIISGIGWRDVVLVVAAMIGVYLALSVLLLFKVTGKRGGKAPKTSTPGSSGWSPFDSRPGSAAPVSTEAAPEFARELAKSSVEVELERLRRESAHQGEELARLSEEIVRLKAARNVSPLYNEAMTLAQQGVSADGIAGHCGISIGEAELVAALARGRNEFERYERGEGGNERNTDH